LCLRYSIYLVSIHNSFFPPQLNSFRSFALPTNPPTSATLRVRREAASKPISRRNPDPNSPNTQHHVLTLPSASTFPTTYILRPSTSWATASANQNPTTSLVEVKPWVQAIHLQSPSLPRRNLLSLLLIRQRQRVGGLLVLLHLRRIAIHVLPLLWLPRYAFSLFE
jgi:hypothetical protein